MKSRMLVSMLVIALAAAVIGGATMAWFTDATLIEGENEATFTAGTLAVNVDGKTVVPMPDREIDNVNPGDCATVCWNIVNEGTKSAELRVKIDARWLEPALNHSDPQVAFFAPEKDSEWVLYEEDGDIYAYFTGGTVAGTYGNVEKEDRTVSLCLVVAFDGPAMDNDYQEESYVIGGEVEAVQATNGAPEAVWGEAWEEVNAGGYEPSGLAGDYLAYVMSTTCWTGEEIVAPDPELDGYDVSDWKVNYVCNGAKITAKIEALDEDGNTFTDLNGPMTVLHGIKYKTYFYSTPATTSKDVSVTFVNGKADFTVTWTGTIYSITDKWIVIDSVEYH